MKKYQKKLAQISVPQALSAVQTDPAAFFMQQENLFDQQIEELCDYILQKQTTMILLAGPSASGKTTTAKKIIAELIRRGKKANRVSLDNFYKSEDKLPYWRDGSRNYESIEALDLDFFQSLLARLWKEGRVGFPVFDFQKGHRVENAFEVEYTKDTYLIFEGIHALHPSFFASMNGHPCVGIYVSVHSNFVDEDGEVLLPAKQLRLSRRIIRDIVSRGSSAENTLSMWTKVVQGEQLYIWPHRMSADIHINSTHGFEPFLYRHRLAEALAHCPANSPFAPAAEELSRLFDRFPPCTPEHLSQGSLIREFYKSL